ncbi:zincin-like metallopeptidase domain-containing protein [uncultured Tenacibaculum sp.]|uniref:zincin-like metallopeptidase domain-containing protein n=1 Tax=uncultured Tenacibaculum sp. TaxID=174713 RepID=UPI002622E679|nr:zincin-like metallopeptidase domain-containing protein [uncultured Tenacibaculum sp.]
MLESLIKQYNELDKTKVTRVFLESYLKKLSVVKNTTEEARFMHGKIKNILKEFPDQEFFIELSKKVKHVNVNQLQGMGIPLYSKPVKDVALGMNGKINAEDIYQMITDKMIDLIEEATGHGYVKRWQETINEFMYPVNFISKKPYRGINHALLTTFGMKSFENPYFLTFKQVEKLKGKIKKGSKSHEVVYFTKLFIFQQDEHKLKIGTYDVKRFVTYIKKHQSKIKHFQNGGSLDSFISQSIVPLLKYYRVFNGADIEGIDFKLDEYRKEFAKTDKEKIATAEAIVKAYPTPKPPLKHGGDRAYYTPTKDFVQIPKLNDFETKEDYYRTLFHEFIHSTGHKKRLDRFVPGTKFGDADYAKEELVAEFGAVFLSAEAGIMWRNDSNHAEYIKGWKRALKHLKNDNKLIFRASSQAQKATDFILQRDEEGVPKYLHGLLKTASKKTSETTKNKAARKKEVVGMNAAEIIVDLPPTKEVFITLPPKKETFVATESNKSATKLQQNEFKEGAPQTLMNTGFSPTVATESNKTATNLQQNSNKIATKPQQNLEPATKVQQLATNEQQKKNPFKTSYELLNSEEAPSEYFILKNQDLSKFLGKIEKKKRGSLVITLDSEEGGGKTHTAYQFANAFAESGYKGVIFSFEEGANNELSKSKQRKYFTEETQKLVTVVEDNADLTKEENFKLIIDNIDYFDLIIVDSWAKVLELNSRAKIDKDFRKKFHGKVFMIINQRTKDGKMRGGSNVAYDGDIILKGVVDRDDFKNNYIYNHKNRYNDYNPLSDLKYSPFYQQLITEEKEIVLNL